MPHYKENYDLDTYNLHLLLPKNVFLFQFHHGSIWIRGSKKGEFGAKFTGQDSNISPKFMENLHWNHQFCMRRKNPSYSNFLKNGIFSAMSFPYCTNCNEMQKMSLDKLSYISGLSLSVSNFSELRCWEDRSKLERNSFFDEIFLEIGTILVKIAIVYYFITCY